MLALLPWAALGAMAMGAPVAVWATTRIGHLPARDDNSPVTYPADEMQREEMRK